MDFNLYRNLIFFLNNSKIQKQKLIRHTIFEQS